MFVEAMPEAADPITFVEMTTDLVVAYVEQNRVRIAELPSLIVTVHVSMAGLGRAPEAEPAPSKLNPLMPIRKTTTDAHIVSLEDGKPYQALKRHLTKRGMTPADYRAKWGLPHDYPMVAPAYSRSRSALAKKTGLGSLRNKR